MNISTLIHTLEAVREEHGDILVATTDYFVPMSVEDIGYDKPELLCFFGLTGDPEDEEPKPPMKPVDSRSVWSVTRSVMRFHSSFQSTEGLRS